MKIFFFHYGEDISTPSMMVESALRTGHEPVQLSPTGTPPIPGCDVRLVPPKHEPIMLERARRYAEVDELGIFLDTDMIVQRDLSPLLQMQCAALLTYRGSTYLSEASEVLDIPAGADLSEKMPFNGGFLGISFPKSPFNQEVYRLMLQMNTDSQRWWGDQLAVAEVAKEMNVIKLPTAIYNRTYNPRESPEQHRLPWVLHFKGNRKQYMRDYLNSTKDIK